MLYRVSLVTGSDRGDELSEAGADGAVHLALIGADNKAFLQRVPCLANEAGGKGNEPLRFQRGSRDQACSAPPSRERVIRRNKCRQTYFVAYSRWRGLVATKLEIC